MGQKPLANDWGKVSEDVQYSKTLDLYWELSTQTVYCPLSAAHNGLIGLGASLKTIIKNSNPKFVRRNNA